MPPVISVVGKSSAGKTTLLERLIPQLRARGYRVATVKHTPHGFDLDRAGKDSWRLSQVGSRIVLLLSPEKLALFQQLDHEIALEELPGYIGGEFDLLLAEGFKEGKRVKIEAHRRELGPDLVCRPEELWAVVSDEPLDLPVMQFSWENIKGLADIIETTFLKGRKE